MRQIDTLNPSELEVLKLKGMLVNHKTERTGSAPIQTKMTKTIILRKRIKDADKKHSVIFSTESSSEADKEIVDAIYFKRPFADGVKQITIGIVRDLDAVVDSM